MHAAKIPEQFRDLSPEARRIMGVAYVNACDDKKWVPAPDALYEPWTLKACERCKLIVSHQPGRSAQRAPIRPRHSN